ncbi:MAG: hypothetical protein ACI4JC_02205 [Faecalibacterium sp.]
MPTLQNEDGTWNADYLSEFSSYFSDHFGLRHEMITLNNLFLSQTLQTLDSESVLAGKDGWLFYRATEADYAGTQMFTRRETFSAARTLKLMQEYCQARGAEFLFVIAPNKNSLYAEKMPSRYPRAQIHNAELLMQELTAQGVFYADLYPVFRNQQEPLYYKTDSHWTVRGAALAGDTILNALGRESDYFHAETIGVAAHAGDLYEMVFPSGTQTEEDAVYSFFYEYTGNYRSADDITIHTLNASGTGSALVFRDSFGINLHPFLAQEYQSVCFSRSMPYRLSLLEQEQSDTVIVELVERNLKWLLTRAPEFPAAQRTRPEFAKQISGAQTAMVKGSNLSEYVCVTGSVEAALVDEDSPIYLEYNGTVYEAAPAGTGTNPFTAYLPAEQVHANGTLYFLSGGQWCCCELNS